MPSSRQRNLSAGGETVCETPHTRCVCHFESGREINAKRSLPCCPECRVGKEIMHYKGEATEDKRREMAVNVVKI